jgi:exonuclease VII small subunit
VLVQAFNDLQRGEQTATALENHLSALEKKIDDLLASAEANQSTVAEKAESSKEAVESSEEKSTEADKSNTAA